MGTPHLARLFFLVALTLLAQPPQRFEVAMIRPTQSTAADGSSLNLFAGGRLKITNEPVRLLIRLAFRLQNSQIAGGPAWLDADRYDIEAKTGRPEKIKQDDVSPLMQNLLAERFNLKYHHETRQLAACALVAVKGEPKLTRNGEGEKSALSSSGGTGASHLVATATPMTLLASYVGNRLGRIVVDKTGLSDTYDFKLDWAPDEAWDSSSPSLVTALREQLGLKLEPQKTPVEVLVIDSIDRPSEN